MPAPGSPVFFKRNRVARVYRGGKLFHDFFGDPMEDGLFPEEWIASTVRARNRDSRDPDEGISILEPDGIPFTRYLLENPRVLGGRAELGVLVKVLDSAIRLPVQAHPDKPFARKYFDSEHGKTEMWIVLATRGQAHIHFGFKQSVTKEQFSDVVRASEQDKEAMVSLLNDVPVNPGDLFLIPPRVVHAIGQGCLILEVQEPTDFTLQPEAWCGDYRLNDFEKYLGLEPNVALECFDFKDLVGEKAVRRGRIEPRVIRSTDTVSVESLVSRADTPDFEVNRYSVRHGSLELHQGPSVLIVIDGEGSLRGRGLMRAVAKGAYFFQPADARGIVIETSSRITVVECQPLPASSAIG